MKTLLIATALLIAPIASQASMNFVCTGDSKSEVLEFVVDEADGLTLTKVSEKLCGNYTSIGELDDGVYVTRSNKQPSKKTVAYDTWEGNWGFEMTIPAVVANGDSESGYKFKAKYHFTYNDIDELELDRTLNCKMK